MIKANYPDFFSKLYFSLKNNLKKFYRNSNFYDKKISKTLNNCFRYRPSPHLLSSIIKYRNKKYKIEDL